MRIPIALALATLIGSPALARAQARVDIHFDLPAVLPPMVVIQPGVQVVPEQREEVFFHDGYYWARRDGYWYHSRDHRGGWVVVPPNRVPPRLVSLPPGHYRNWKAEKEHRKAVRKAERRHEREERWEDRHGGDHGDHGGGDHGRGHGRGHGRD